MTLTRWGDEKPESKDSYINVYVHGLDYVLLFHWMLWTDCVWRAVDERHSGMNGEHILMQETRKIPDNARWCYVPEMDWSKADD